MLVHSIFSVSSTGSYKEEEKASETIAKYFEVSFRERLHMANGGERWYTGKGSQLPLMQYARISGLLLVRFSSFRSFIFFSPGFPYKLCMSWMVYIKYQLTCIE